MSKLIFEEISNDSIGATPIKMSARDSAGIRYVIYIHHSWFEDKVQVGIKASDCYKCVDLNVAVRDRIIAEGEDKIYTGNVERSHNGISPKIHLS